MVYFNKKWILYSLKQKTNAMEIIILKGTIYDCLQHETNFICENAFRLVVFHGWLLLNVIIFTTIPFIKYFICLSSLFVASFNGLYCILHIWHVIQDQTASFMNTQQIEVCVPDTTHIQDVHWYHKIMYVPSWDWSCNFWSKRSTSKSASNPPRLDYLSIL